jgi:hypothetical protein
MATISLKEDFATEKRDITFKGAMVLSPCFLCRCGDPQCTGEEPEALAFSVDVDGSLVAYPKKSVEDWLSNMIRLLGLVRGAHCMRALALCLGLKPLAEALSVCPFCGQKFLDGLEGLDGHLAQEIQLVKNDLEQHLKLRRDAEGEVPSRDTRSGSRKCIANISLLGYDAEETARRLVELPSKMAEWRQRHQIV